MRGCASQAVLWFKDGVTGSSTDHVIVLVLVDENETPPVKHA